MWAYVYYAYLDETKIYNKDYLIHIYYLATYIVKFIFYAGLNILINFSYHNKICEL